jgi:hypothetical protein
MTSHCMLHANRTRIELKLPLGVFGVWLCIHYAPLSHCAAPQDFNTPTHEMVHESVHVLCHRVNHFVAASEHIADTRFVP